VTKEKGELLKLSHREKIYEYQTPLGAGLGAFPLPAHPTKAEGSDATPTLANARIVEKGKSRVTFTLFLLKRKGSIENYDCQGGGIFS
jgi:hypothetical protein